MKKMFMFCPSIPWWSCYCCDLKPLVMLRAARPWSFTATLGPVALGTALAYKFEDAFSAPLLLFSLITTLGVHAAGNLGGVLFGTHVAGTLGLLRGAFGYLSALSAVQTSAGE